MRYMGVIVGVALAAVLGLACDSDDSPAPHEQEVRPSSVSIPPSRLAGDCKVGETPTYRVPHSGASAPITAGCVVLGVSGKRMELSANNGRHAGKRTFCLYPAFAGRGYRGMYIPTICHLKPAEGLVVTRSQVPTQGVRGYELVLWGYTRGSEAVTARYGASEAEAAVFPAPDEVSPAGMSLFVLELPSEAGCETIEVRDDAGGRDRVRPTGRTCPRLRGSEYEKGRLG